MVRKPSRQTNDKIGGVEEHEEVYIPGAGRLGKLNNRDLRRLNQEADFDTRYIMLSNFSFTILSFESIYRFAKDLDRYKKDSVEALAKLQANREKQKPDDPLEYWVMVRCLCSTKLADVACDILCIPASSVPSERLFSVAGVMCAGKNVRCSLLLF